MFFSEWIPFGTRDKSTRSCTQRLHQEKPLLHVCGTIISSAVILTHEKKNTYYLLSMKTADVVWG